MLQWTGKACEADGIKFEVRNVDKMELEKKLQEAIDDPLVSYVTRPLYTLHSGPIGTTMNGRRTMYFFCLLAMTWYTRKKPKFPF